jgi:hypothetical protein
MMPMLQHTSCRNNTNIYKIFTLYNEGVSDVYNSTSEEVKVVRNRYFIKDMIIQGI